METKGPFMRISWLFILPIFALVSYGVGRNNGETQPQEELSPADSIIVTKLPTRIEEKADTQTTQYLTRLDSIYTSVPLFFQEDGHFYFYVVNGDWIQYDKETSVPKFLMGIVDENFDTILPPAYHKIYSPNGTAKGYIEIEVDGKRGLVNYHTRQIVPATFDVIFPSHADGVAAIGKRGNQYYNILPDGSEQLITDKAKVPTYLSIQKDLAFDIKEHFPLLRDNSYWYFKPRGNRKYYYNSSSNNGVIVPSSYLVATGFVSEWISNISSEDNGMPPKLIESRNSIEQTKTTKWGIDILISDFYQYGISTRSYYTTKEKVVATIDSNNNVIDKAVLFTNWGSTHGILRFEAKKPFRFIGDSLMEAPYQSLWHDKTDDPQPYHAMSSYQYYEIKRNGELQKLKSNRVFAFTKYIYITEDYFKGSYVFDNDHDGKDTIAWPNDDEIWYYVTNHLSVYDLDLMYNEVLAEYGYKFKDAKWDDYFRQQEWYTPRFDNVDDKLNPYEKANLKLIKSTRSKMAKNPEKYIQGRFEEYKYAYQKRD